MSDMSGNTGRDAKQALDARRGYTYFGRHVVRRPPMTLLPDRSPK